MISYAQNAEDVVLARVLPGDTGFYVDIGASSPDASSVTRHFYEKGWRGINVEPRLDAWEELKERRPRDLNLPIAVGGADGTSTLYYVVEDPDLSTIDPDDLAYLSAKGYSYKELEVQVRTMDSMLATAGVTSIDFLKIDAEGAEAAILNGMDLRRWRPRVIVVEAVRPWSRDRTDDQWRGILEANGYREGLFDGVNLFFAPEEHPEVFRDLVPASALDQYETAELAAVRRELEWRRARLGIVTPAPIRPRVASAVPGPHGFLVAGAEHSGLEWVAGALAATLGTTPSEYRHPADIDWSDLPATPVLALAWGRTPGLDARLRAAGIRVVSPARHPIDVLGEAYLRRYGAESGFVTWAVSAEARRLVAPMAEWWSTPATVRVRWERLLEDPEAELHTLLQNARLNPAHLRRIPGPVAGPGPIELSGDDRGRLEDEYADLLHRLGYRAEVRLAR